LFCYSAIFNFQTQPATRLPSQLQSMVTFRLAPNYTAWWQSHMWTTCPEFRGGATGGPRGHVPKSGKGCTRRGI